MENVNVNIVETAVKANRTPLSMIGGNLFGQDVFVPQTRLSNPDYDKVIANVHSLGDADLCLNRSPRRFNVFSYTVTDMRVAESITGEVVLKINPDTDHEIEIPASTLENFGKTTDDAVREAMKNPEKKMVFSDPKKLCLLMNQLNRAEITRIDAAIDMLNKAKAQCVSTISKNEQKVNTYYDEKEKSKPQAEVSVKVNVTAQTYGSYLV